MCVLSVEIYRVLAKVTSCKTPCKALFLKELEINSFMYYVYLLYKKTPIFLCSKGVVCIKCVRLIHIYQRLLTL